MDHMHLVLTSIDWFHPRQLCDYDGLLAGRELMTEETIEHMASVVEAQGTDAFWQAPIEELLPESLKGEAPKLEKRLETMDVWFDSGTSWAGCVEGTEGLSFPADLYLEVSRALFAMGASVPWGCIPLTQLCELNSRCSLRPDFGSCGCIIYQTECEGWQELSAHARECSRR